MIVDVGNLIWSPTTQIPDNTARNYTLPTLILPTHTEVMEIIKFSIKSQQSLLRTDHIRVNKMGLTAGRLPAGQCMTPVMMETDRRRRVCYRSKPGQRLS